MSTSGTAAAQQKLPISLQLASGAIAGLTEIFAMYPLDVIKTRQQLLVGSGLRPSTLQTLTDIVLKEGTSRLYRGILAPVLIEAPKRATKFASNELYAPLLRPYFASGQKHAIATGVCAGLTEAFMVVSFELVKIRMQDKTLTGRYAGVLDCVRQIYRQEGILSFGRGLEATLWRHAAWNGGYFGVIHWLRASLPAARSKLEKLRNDFISGAVGGTVGTVLNTPFDVVKTRIQAKVGEARVPWAAASVISVAQKEGVGALYKGFGPKVLRLGPGGGILLIVYDQVSGFFRSLQRG